MQSEELGGQMLGMMWLQKFSHSQHSILLLVWHVKESCCQRKVLSLSQSSRALPPPGTMLSLRTYWKINGGITLPLLETSPKKNDVDWVFGFHHYQYILWGQSKPMVVLWVDHLFLEEIFLIWEKLKHWPVGRDAWVYSKALRHNFFIILHCLW